MTLVFSGHDYKYELEGVLKLFVPAAKFELIYGSSFPKEGDTVFTRVMEFRSYALVYVIVRYSGSYYRKAQRIFRDTPDEKSDSELILSRLIYELLSRAVGIVPKWGVLTGIRPVKRVNTWLNEGKGREEIFRRLREDYLCSEEKCETAYATAMAQKRILDRLEPESFSLYVNIPFCPTRCSYCSFISQTVDSGRKLLPEYISKLCRELRQIGLIVKRLGLKLDTVYFGGGTPTSIDSSMLCALMKCIEHSFDMSSVREYTVEAGRPDTVTEEKLRTLKENGCTRVSINPQSLNDKVLEAIGRRHTADEFFQAFDTARRVGFDSINTDIIAGLPEDTPESFAFTVDKLLELSPENLTVHTLSIKRAAELNRGDRSILNNPAGDMVEYAGKRLREEGYSPYYLYRQKNMVGNLENIGWCREGFESLYNIYIMEEVQTIIAAGAGASTKLVGKGRLERVFNYKFPLEYIKHFDLMLERKDEIVKFYENA